MHEQKTIITHAARPKQTAKGIRELNDVGRALMSQVPDV
jgi:hypothetical protein